MMIGTCDQPRSLAITSLPSMSGRPRSRITSAGAAVAAALSASAPFKASTTSKPAASSAGRRKRWICGSSSTTRMRSRLIVPPAGFRSPGLPGTAGDASAASLHGGAFGADRPAHRLDEPLGDGEAQTSPGSSTVRFAAPEEFFEDIFQVLCGNSLAEIGDGNDDIGVFGPGIDADRIAAPVLHSIVHQIEQHLPQKHAVAPDQR